MFTSNHLDQITITIWVQIQDQFKGMQRYILHILIT